MASLETLPMVEALLPNGVNLTLLLNNIWTWLAVMTAAVGFWRIRFLKPDLVVVPAEKPCCPPLRPVQDRTQTEPERTVSTSTLWEEETAATSPTKGNKYRAFYSYCMHEEVEEEKENDGALGGWECSGAAAVVEEWMCDSPPSSSAALGWYRYQDRRVLDGSVVRLWDHSSSSSSPTKTTSLTRYLPLGL